jgi:hypothetical protein
MNLIDQDDERGNWWEALRIWEKLANWTRFIKSDSEFRNQAKMLLICLWNEKDWLKSHYPDKQKGIERFINDSKYICIAGDLANTVKHRKLTMKRRSSASQTGYYGRVTTGNGETRRLYFINDGKGGHPEIMEILRGALDEFEILHHQLHSNTI